MFRHILIEVREPMPSWLARYEPGMIESPTCGPNAIESYLQSRIAFYPGSGLVDGELFETFTTAHAPHCVLHADQMRPASLISEMMSRKFRPHIHVFGYRSLEVLVWDADKTRALLGLIQNHPFDQDPKLRGACWVVLERESDRTDAHGPSRLALLKPLGAESPTGALRNSPPRLANRLTQGGLFGRDFPIQNEQLSHP